MILQYRCSSKPCLNLFGSIAIPITLIDFSFRKYFGSESIKSSTLPPNLFQSNYFRLRYSDIDLFAYSPLIYIWFLVEHGLLQETG